MVLRQLALIGAGGLIGSAIASEAKRFGIGVSSPKVAWGTGKALPDLQEWMETLHRNSNSASLDMIWAAGVPDMRASRDVLSSSSSIFTTFLEWLTQNSSSGALGSISYISSLGGIYEQTNFLEANEEVRPEPLSAYGAFKMSDEDSLAKTGTLTGIRTLSVRLPSVFGPSSSFSIRGGLINSLSLSTILRRPMRIYVPLDTLRPYLYVRDVPRFLLRLLAELRQFPPATNETKNVLSPTMLSVATIIGEFKRTVHALPPISYGVGLNHTSPAQLSTIRSSTFSGIRITAPTPFRAAIKSTFNSVLIAHSEGRLTP